MADMKCGLCEINKNNRANATHGPSLIQNMFRGRTETIKPTLGPWLGPEPVVTLLVSRHTIDELYCVQQQQQRPGSGGGSRSSASPAATHGHTGGTHGHTGGSSDSRHASSTEVRRSVSPHRPATAGGASSSGTPSRLSGQHHRDKASPARHTNDRSQLTPKSSQNTQELLNKGTDHCC